MKAKILRVSSNRILDFFKPGVDPAYESIEKHLPEDAKITGEWIQFEYPGEIWLRVESETFPEVEPGCQIPFLDSPIFRTRKEGGDDEMRRLFILEKG